jgi:CBS-domain-containing membrane protein
MAELFATGHIVDGILVLMLLELGVLTLLRLRTRRGLTAIELVVSLGAGAALLMALRAALLGAPWQHVAPWLAAALVAHLVDLKLRWNPRRSDESVC